MEPKVKDMVMSSHWGKDSFLVYLLVILGLSYYFEKDTENILKHG